MANARINGMPKFKEHNRYILDLFLLEKQRVTERIKGKIETLPSVGSLHKRLQRSWIRSTEAGKMNQYLYEMPAPQTEAYNAMASGPIT